jgi:DNA-directed RNA polymerase subunit H (RpoH/RPB5)
MHALQPKHIKLKPEEVKKLLEKYNLSVSQLAKIKNDDPAIVSMGCVSGDILRIERKEDDKINTYFRVVV